MFQPQVWAGSNEILDKTILEYETYGFNVPELNIFYVNEIKNNPNIQAIYLDGMIVVKKNADDVKSIRHEVAHSISVELIKSHPVEFETYRNKRIGNYKPVNTWYNLTADECNLRIQWYYWYLYTLDVRELVAEDLRYLVYGGANNLDYTIGRPSQVQQSKLKELLLLKE